MKFTCTQENLNWGLSVVSRTASKNVALPILNNVLIVAEANGLKLITTNLELGVSVAVRGKIEQPGRYTVPSRLLTDFVSYLKNEKVTLELTDGGLLVTSGHSRTTIKGLPADDFPVLPTIEGGTKTSLPSLELQRCLEGVIFAAANDESRPEISGVYVKINDRALTVAATDSYRLAERSTQTLVAAPQPQELILPARAAHELLRLISAGQPELQLQATEAQARFQLGEIELVSRLIDGRYPEYGQIIPREWQTKIICDREALINNIRAASLFCKPGINDLTLRADPTKKQLQLQAANTQLGEHEASLEAKIEGGEASIVFNYRYLLEGLQSLSGDSAELDLTDAQAPGVLRPGGKTDALYLLMPIRQ